MIVFEPVTHAAHFIDVKGESTRERQNLAMIFSKVHAPTGTTTMRPGPLRLALENRSDTRTLPSVWIAGDELHQLLGKRRPFLTAKRLLSNQTFRDIYRTDTLDVDQGLKITSLTFLSTDLKGSTAPVSALLSPTILCASISGLSRSFPPKAAQSSKRSATR